MMAAAEGARFAKDILELVEERDQEEEGGNKKADRELHTEGAKEEVLEEGEDVETEDEALLVCNDNQLMAYLLQGFGRVISGRYSQKGIACHNHS